MRRIAVAMLVFLAVIGSGTASAATGRGMSGSGVASAGLTVAARWALLGDAPTAVVLVGRYSCGPFPDGVPDRGVIDLGVTQVVGGAEVRGIGYLTPTVCDGTAQWFAAELTAVGGVAFRRGTATWAASGYVEGGGGMQHVSVAPTRIRIQ
jgi:hypothetical protein